MEKKNLILPVLMEWPRVSLSLDATSKENLASSLGSKRPKKIQTITMSFLLSKESKFQTFSRDDDDIQKGNQR